MSDKLPAAWSAVAERLRSLAAEDEAFRKNLRIVAEQLLALTDRPEGEVAKQAPPPPAAPPAAAEPGAPPSDGQAAIVERLTLDSGITPVEKPADPPSFTAPATDSEPATDWTRAAVADSDLHLIETRCRLKAEGARWAATRERRLGDGADFRTEIEPQDREIIERARALPDCFLWMCHPRGPSPIDLSLWEDVAGCFDALAAAVAVIRELLDAPDEHPEGFERALDLAAEAQSAVRMAIQAVEGPENDPDQLKVHRWLRATAAKQQVFIQRYMRLGDPADPTNWSELTGRIEQLDGELQDRRERHKRRQSLLRRVRYHLRHIQNGDAGDARHDWHRVIESVERMIEEGVKPSDRELRELLLPVAEGLPEFDELPAGFARVLREMDRFLAVQRASAGAEAAPEQPTEEVRRAAELLRGRTVAMIGGVRRPDAAEALRNAFGLKEFLWVEAREHQPVSSFEPHVARPDVALVILAIRWSSHSFGEVKEFCDRYGKPLVRLRAGYNPNQVAVHILDQCSEQLARSA